MKEQEINETIENMDEEIRNSIPETETYLPTTVVMENDDSDTSEQVTQKETTEEIKPKRKRKKKSENLEESNNDSVEKEERSSDESIEPEFLLDKNGKKVHEGDYIRIVNPISRYSDGSSVLTSDHMCSHKVYTISDNLLRLRNGHTVHPKYVVKV